MASSPASFDARNVPVIGVDTHWPAVPVERLQLHALEQRFQRWPAGLGAEGGAHGTKEAQGAVTGMPQPLTPAAVLVLVVLHPQPTVLLTQRTQHLSTHSGQVAFPGGRIDAHDRDAQAAALRETHEEVGLPAHCVRVLGQLPVHITGTAFEITPIVGVVQPGFSLQPNAHEVEEVFEVPLPFLMNPANHRHHALQWQGRHRQWVSMPYQDGDKERFIWGATAAILRSFYHFLMESDEASLP